ncbi:DUF421 domain-containing protein [Citreicella sp. C3M06]|uniref:DUF421 domain-containing protein n=1 Tax=Citreicella sp. C3M06 TaxID=2841564 RepID=UPI001C0A65AC|nr:DUF421 domain-containing protein [Citreicella sp. C3M06]
MPLSNPSRTGATYELVCDVISGVERHRSHRDHRHAFLVVPQRASGNRTLAKLDASDLVVTVAFGFTLSSMLASADVALAEGAVALILVIALRYGMMEFSARSRRFARAERSEPSLRLRDGAQLPYAMRRASVTRETLEVVVRSARSRQQDDMSVVTLKSDGSFSAIGGEAARTGT